MADVSGPCLNDCLSPRQLTAPCVIGIRKLACVIAIRKPLQLGRLVSNAVSTAYQLSGL